MHMTQSRKCVFIVIAAFNESRSIVKVVKDLKKGGYKNIVVVDDGSKDNTFELAKSQNVFVVKHIINRGQGAALKTGIDFALKQGAGIIVTFDADGQHNVSEIIKLISQVSSGKFDVALGSRFLRKETAAKVPFMRRFLLKGSVFITRCFYGIKLTDTHNGFRALSRTAAQKIKITSNTMEHASEIIEEISKNKLRYIEVPVTIKYSRYSLEHGHGSFFGALKVFFKMIVKKITE